MLVENISNPSIEQLEFIIGNGGSYIVSYIDKLYRLVVKHNREDLLQTLQYTWEKYGYPTPVKCPKCGFRAVMPDYSCFICGYVVGEDYVRRELDFPSKFQIFIEQASVAELREVMDLGIVLIGDSGVFNPKHRYNAGVNDKYLYPIYLKGRDIGLILEEIGRRKIEV